MCKVTSDMSEFLKKIKKKTSNIASDSKVNDTYKPKIKEKEARERLILSCRECPDFKKM